MSGQPGFLGSPEEALRRTSQTSLQTGSIGYVLLHEEPTDHCFCCMSAKDFDSSLDDDDDDDDDNNNNNNNNNNNAISKAKIGTVIFLRNICVY